MDRELKQMADSLKLTQDQRDKARPILLDQGYQLKQVRTRYAAMEKTPETTQAMTRDIHALRAATDAKLAQVFTGEQMTEYKRMRDAALARLRTKVGAPATPAAADTARHAAPADTTKK